MTKPPRTLWPAEDGDKPTFSEALTTDPVRTEHTCNALVGAFEQTLKLPRHHVSECPGPWELSSLIAASYHLEDQSCL